MEASGYTFNTAAGKWEKGLGGDPGKAARNDADPKLGLGGLEEIKRSGYYSSLNYGPESSNDYSRPTRWSLGAPIYEQTKNLWGVETPGSYDSKFSDDAMKEIAKGFGWKPEYGEPPKTIIGPDGYPDYEEGKRWTTEIGYWDDEHTKTLSSNGIWTGRKVPAEVWLSKVNAGWREWLSWQNVSQQKDGRIMGPEFKDLVASEQDVQKLKTKWEWERSDPFSGGANGGGAKMSSVGGKIVQNGIEYFLYPDGRKKDMTGNILYPPWTQDLN